MLQNLNKTVNGKMAGSPTYGHASTTAVYID